MSTALPWLVLVRHVSDIKMRMQKLDQIEHAVFDTRNALKHVDKSVRDLTIDYVYGHLLLGPILYMRRMSGVGALLLMLKSWNKCN